MRQQVREVGGGFHLVLVGGDFAALVGGADPDSEQLGDLLPEGHHGDQGFGAFLRGEGRVLPGGRGAGGGQGIGGGRGAGAGRGIGGGGSRVHVVVHFPPTPISPWTRARRANR